MPGPAPSVEEQRAFIDGIVPRHEMASMMADDAIAKARSKPDSLAHHTNEEQKKEQQDMRDSIRVWYGTPVTFGASCMTPLANQR